MMRIVSLLPSATEIVCALGLQNQLVGITHECDYPPYVRQLPKVTHTLIPSGVCSREIDRLVRLQLQEKRALYTLNMAVLNTLQPDIIITQTLCDVCAVAEQEVRAAACQLPGNPRIINLEPQTLDDVFASIRGVASAIGVERIGDEVTTTLQTRVNAVAARSAVSRCIPRVALLEWLDPPFSCGHWTPGLVRLAGGEEGFGREGEPSQTLDWNVILAWKPEVIFIACCGFTVQRTLADLSLLGSVKSWFDSPAVANGRVYVVDGSHYFSRPGPRLVDSLEILAHALHPDLHPLSRNLPPAVCVSHRDAYSQNDPSVGHL